MLETSACHEHHCLSDGDLLQQALGTVVASRDLQTALDRLAALLRRHFGCTRIALHRVLPEDADWGEVLLVDDPRQPRGEAGGRYPVDGSLLGAVRRSGQPVVIPQIDAAEAAYREERPLREAGYGTVACFPLVVEGRVFGCMEIAHPPDDRILDRCLQHALRVSRVVAIALHNSLLVEQVARLNRLLRRENDLLREQIAAPCADGEFVAGSPPMKLLMQRVEQVAPTDTTVLIAGETGTGKEGLARVIHERSPRRQGPFVPVNLGALPAGLVESELFGYEPGAFTGAHQLKRGRFELARGGTIFLDEIGDAPAELQVRLLRVLQEREIDRLGGTRPTPVDVRVIAATHQDLPALLAAGRFREDLYYRIAAFPLQLPPLRDRQADLRRLIEVLVERIARRLNRRPPGIPEAIFDAVAKWTWPGNVRELENWLERAMILCAGEELLPVEAPGAGAMTSGAAPGSFDEEVRSLLQRALRVCGGRIYGPRGAAALLDLKPTTLQGKLRRFGLR